MPAIPGDILPYIPRYPAISVVSLTHVSKKKKLN